MKTSRNLLLLLIAAISTLSSQALADDAEDSGYIETPIDEFDRDHWSFLPIEPVSIPMVGKERSSEREFARAWIETPIDAFILSPLVRKGIKPVKRADRATLIRRLSFDLTGLPPTPEQLDAFVSDERPEAYRRLVDRVLASPEYGRRWGQYWLDLARYADTDGYEHDKVRPEAWKYRDWVIQAFNEDLRYDQFVEWQIAGDLLAPSERRAEGITATAFCLSGPDMPDINSQDEREHVLLNEITSTVGSVFFSLQMGCAQCHDHMYDAISQADFYRLRAFFDDAIAVKRDRSVSTLKANADANHVSHLMIRGDWRRKGQQLVAAYPRIADLEDSPNHTDTLRRSDLANWLTSERNPLTARSIVNRVWQHHFGKGLSTTPSDFGVMGNEPTHPELLDYLAGQLIHGGWSLKRLHREIVLSSVFTTASAPDEAALPVWRNIEEVDPENKLLARFPRRRLEAEALRDAMLAVGHSLNRSGGGVGIQPPLPTEMLQTLKRGQWKTTPHVPDHYRRSIYLFARRNLRYPFFATFDRPAANSSCAARQPSTTAVQSLLLFNSELTMDAAERLAASVSRDHATNSQRCVELCRRLYSRDASASELDHWQRFLASQSTLLHSEGHSAPHDAALVDLCRALLNTSEFLYID